MIQSLLVSGEIKQVKELALNNVICFSSKQRKKWIEITNHFF